MRFSIKEIRKIKEIKKIKRIKKIKKIKKSKKSDLSHFPLENISKCEIDQLYAEFYHRVRKLFS